MKDKGQPEPMCALASSFSGRTSENGDRKRGCRHPTKLCWTQLQKPIGCHKKLHDAGMPVTPIDPYIIPVYTPVYPYITLYEEFKSSKKQSRLINAQEN